MQTYYIVWLESYEMLSTFICLLVRSSNYVDSHARYSQMIDSNKVQLEIMLYVLFLYDKMTLQKLERPIIFQNNVGSAS